MYLLNTEVHVILETNTTTMKHVALFPSNAESRVREKLAENKLKMHKEQ